MKPQSGASLLMARLGAPRPICPPVEGYSDRLLAQEPDPAPQVQQRGQRAGDVGERAGAQNAPRGHEIALGDVAAAVKDRERAGEASVLSLTEGFPLARGCASHEG